VPLKCEVRVLGMVRPNGRTWTKRGGRGRGREMRKCTAARHTKSGTAESRRKLSDSNDGRPMASLAARFFYIQGRCSKRERETEGKTKIPKAQNTPCRARTWAIDDSTASEASSATAIWPRQRCCSRGETSGGGSVVLAGIKAAGCMQAWNERRNTKWSLDALDGVHGRSDTADPGSKRSTRSTPAHSLHRTSLSPSPSTSPYSNRWAD